MKPQLYLFPTVYYISDDEHVAINPITPILSTSLKEALNILVNGVYEMELGNHSPVEIKEGKLQENPKEWLPAMWVQTFPYTNSIVDDPEKNFKPEDIEGVPYLYPFGEQDEEGYIIGYPLILDLTPSHSS